MARSEDMKTPLMRLAFADSLSKMQEVQGGKKRYGCSLLMAKSADWSKLYALALEAAKAEWGDKAEKLLADGLIHNPFLDGDGPQGKSKKTGAPHSGFPGMKFIRAISGEDYPPRLYNKKVRPATKEEIYSGVWGFAVVNAFTWENVEKGKGISFGISMFQAVKDDENLGGGGAPPEDYFEPIADESDATPIVSKDGKGAAGLFG